MPRQAMKFPTLGRVPMAVFINPTLESLGDIHQIGKACLSQQLTGIGRPAANATQQIEWRVMTGNRCHCCNKFWVGASALICNGKQECFFTNGGQVRCARKMPDVAATSFCAIVWTVSGASALA